MCATTFWKTVKPFIWDKIASKEQITLVENNEIIQRDSDVMQTLNSFFSNIVTRLKIPAYVDSNSNLKNLADPTLKYEPIQAYSLQEKYAEKNLIALFCLLEKAKMKY